MNPLLIGSIGLGLLTQARLTTIEREQQAARTSFGRLPPSHPARFGGQVDGRSGGTADRRTGGQAGFGFTAPTDIYEVMRQIQTSAAALDPDVITNVADPAFKRAWSAWFAEWRVFFDSNYRTFKTLLHSDELKGQVETYRSQLLSWYEGYQRQVGTDGKPVPTPKGVPPLRPPPEVEAGKGGLPWWVWLVGGAALVGVGYLGYRYYQRAQETKRIIHTEVLPGLIGAPLARAAASRDPERVLSPQSSGRARDADPRTGGPAEQLTGGTADRDYVLTNFDRDHGGNPAGLPAWYLEGRR